MTAFVAPAPQDALQFVKFLDFLQSREKHALGFLPFKALEQAISLGRVLLCFENDEPAGYAIHGPPKNETKIYQVVICDDVRRIEHGTALVEAITQRANANMSEILTLHCAEDLEANSFWQALGFNKTGQRCKRKDGKRLQNRYEIILPGQAIRRELQKEEQNQIRRKLNLDGLTNLKNLLLKNDKRHDQVRFLRKKTNRHIILTND